MSVAYSGLSAHASFGVEQFHDARHTHAHEQVAEETPVALSYNGQSFAVMMATPQDLEDFAIGFSLSEGIVARRVEIEELKVERHPEGIAIEMKIDAERFAALDARQRNLTGRTGCGLCGARSLEQAIRHPDPLTREVTLQHQAVQTAVQQLAAQQPLNALSGALHAAAWAQLDGSIVCVREDVGRHNALDKLIGALIARETDFDAGFAVMTSRASYELIQKAAICGISALVAVSAPTALAIRLAREVGLCLIGFARPGRHTVYAQPQRVVDAPRKAFA
jgi:formate dehydrogenase accessory protein FdhD